MDKAKEVAKRGWHPKGKDGGRESWRSDYKPINTVATKLGHGKPAYNETAKDHQSRPLASLKDPDAFGPPPKNVNYHGGAASPSSNNPDRGGLGAPLSPTGIRDREEREQQAIEAPSKPAAPPLPYRADRTGLNTANLPKPPVRRMTNPAESPASATSARPPVRSIANGATSPASATSTKPPKPNLPPRLPPRQNSNPLLTSPDPPPPYTPVAEPSHQSIATQEGSVNQNAVSRLGAAGVSVPGFGIGRSSQNASNSQEQPSSTQGGSSISNLRSRFGNMSTINGEGSTNPASPPPSASGSTSFAQKQAALKTASNFRSDPSSVSLQDARESASTANNFRERHGDQVAQGWKVGSGLNQKYGVANKLGAATTQTGTADRSSSSSPPVPALKPFSPPSSNSPIGSSAGINRKPPPPPVPHGSKPR